MQHGIHRKFAVTILALLMGSMGGCIVYHAVPIDPEQTRREFFQRSLSDPGLLEYVRQPRSSKDDVILAAAPATQAASAPATEPATAWTVDSLTRAALYFHPDLRAARARLSTAQAAEVAAGEMPNPTVSIAPEFSSNPAEANPWVLGFTFDIPIETAGKREHRIAAARAGIMAARYELADVTWKIRGRVRDALINYLLDLRTIEALQQEVHARETQMNTLSARLQAGAAGRTEVDLVRIDLLTSRQLLRAKQGEMADDRTKLAAAIGIPPEALEGQTLAWPGVDRLEAITKDHIAQLQLAGLINRLDIRKALADYDAAEANLQLEIAKQYPDLHIGPGYTFDQGQNKWQLGVSLELPILNQNAGAIFQARARRDELAANFIGLQAQVIAETASAQARYEAALLELEDAGTQFETTGRQVSASERALELGSEDRLTVSGLQVQQTVAARLRLDALRKAQLARGAIEDAIQRPLPQENDKP